MASLFIAYYYSIIIDYYYNCVSTEIVTIDLFPVNTISKYVGHEL